MANDDYWFGVETVRKMAQLCDWWLHLSGKSWFEVTGWADLVRKRVMPQLEER